MEMLNTPKVKLGIVGVSRDCFPIELTRSRLAEVVKECAKLKLSVTACTTIVQSEGDAVIAAAELESAEVNALVVYLGNFGPEAPLTILAEIFGGPFMLCGAAEESRATLIHGRGDAFCGMLNACLNAGLRSMNPHVPAMPIGLPNEVAVMIQHFEGVARVVQGVTNLKVIGYGPRPQDFYACNAPIKPLYDLGVEVTENSELDLLMQYKEAAAHKAEIEAVAADMALELGAGNRHPEKLRQLAQFEVALVHGFQERLGSRQFGVYANKCWPSFEKAFGFVPCYVNSRLAGRGIPVACEVDIYGAVSEYMLQLACQNPVTLLDINNTVPADVEIKYTKGVARNDMFMGFHCGNTASCCLCEGFAMKFQLIMNRLMEEPGKAPDITCGTLEGTLKPGPTTLFRLQPTPDSSDLMSYIAEGDILDADPASFGSIGVFGIRDFARFYRYILLGWQFPHHAAVGFRHAGFVLYDALKMLGVEDVGIPKAAGHLYDGENPFQAALRTQD